jgi:hypothetical protein
MTRKYYHIGANEKRILGILLTTVRAFSETESKDADYAIVSANLGSLTDTDATTRTLGN